MFIDELEIYVEAGNGGNGCVSFRREKYVEFGGPNGGDGGKGGDVVFLVKPEFNTLLPLRSLRHYKAGRGRNGGGSNMTGASGDDLILEVPRGTVVRDRETGTLIADLTGETERVVVAHGGRGGKGNKHFASSTHRTPRFSQPGEEGERLWLRLELKMIADVGLVGFPNAGKSTLISRLSAARPKVADYPFTTLKPNLGVVAVSAFESFVIADIPGIIEGAHEGAGLGLRFLRHIERTSVLLLLIDPGNPELGIMESFEVLRNELRSFSQRLERKQMVVALTKADVPHQHEDELSQLMEALAGEGIPHYIISAVRGDNLKELTRDLYEMVREVRAKDPEAALMVEEQPEPEPNSPHHDPLDELN